MPREFRSFRVEAVIIKHHDSGEADRIVTLFSREQGKLRAVARGVRKIRSRRAGHLEPFTHVSLQLAKSKTLPIVTQAETIEAHLALRDDLTLLGYASYIAELLDKFTYEEGEHIALFNLFRLSLTRLTKTGADPLLALRYYEIRLLDLTGFRPDLTQCVLCGEQIKAENQYFSAANGGVVCPSCGRGREGVLPVTQEALRFLRHFQRSAYDDALRASPSQAVHQEMEMLMQYYISYVLERGLNTPKFLRDIRKK
jgi:DNA repair protein RecO (recombination protein O)